MVPAENKAKRLSLVNLTTKTIHHQFIILVLKYSIKFMAPRSFTSSLVNFLNNHQSLEYTTLCLLQEQNFYQIKVITMMKNCDQSIEINHNPNLLYS